MKKTIYTLLATMLIVACGPKTMSYDYDAICDGVGASGTYIVKVFTKASTVKKAKDKTKSHAVHAVLFKGIAGGNNCQSQKSICNVSYTENRAWFNNFFNSGDYLQYVSYTDNAYIAAKDMVKMGNGKYKIGVNVIVQANALRKKMEKEGFARSLSQGF